VLDAASETQVLEMERQVAEDDRSYFDQLTESYGWSRDQGDEVWQWFKAKPGKSWPSGDAPAR
jgi:hypothetical protein